MNPGQKMFHKFVLECVQPGKEPEMEALMTESFKRQDESTFTPEYMGEIVPKMVALLQPGRINDFKSAAAHMRGQVESE